MRKAFRGSFLLASPFDIGEALAEADLMLDDVAVILLN